MQVCCVGPRRQGSLAWGHAGEGPGLSLRRLGVGGDLRG